jgi:hypothetical protein
MLMVENGMIIFLPIILKIFKMMGKFKGEFLCLKLEI